MGVENTFSCSCGFAAGTSNNFYKHVAEKAEMSPGQPHTRIFSSTDKSLRAPSPHMTPSPLSRGLSSPWASWGHARLEDKEVREREVRKVGACTVTAMPIARSILPPEREARGGTEIKHAVVAIHNVLEIIKVGFTLILPPCQCHTYSED